MRWLPRLLIVVLLAALLVPIGHAARDVDTTATRHAGQELLVFESRTCTYCQLFRRDVLASYQQSGRARELPLRFVDFDQADLTRVQLEAPLSTLPTAVVMRDGREVGRIPGYTGPDTFFAMLGHILGSGTP